MRRIKGFTLIELLIVIVLVIISILAAIAIPRFTSSSSYDAAAKTDLRNAMTAQEAYYSDNQTYAGSIIDLDPYLDTPDENVDTIVVSSDDSSYVMCSQHAEAEHGWQIVSGFGQIHKLPLGCGR